MALLQRCSFLALVSFSFSCICSAAALSAQPISVSSVFCPPSSPASMLFRSLTEGGYICAPKSQNMYVNMCQKGPKYVKNMCNIFPFLRECFDPYAKSGSIIRNSTIWPQLVCTWVVFHCKLTTVLTKSIYSAVPAFQRPSPGSSRPYQFFSVELHKYTFLSFQREKPSLN